MSPSACPSSKGDGNMGQFSLSLIYVLNSKEEENVSEFGVL